MFVIFTISKISFEFTTYNYSFTDQTFNLLLPNITAHDRRNRDFPLDLLHKMTTDRVETEHFSLNLLQKLTAHDSVTDMTQNVPLDLLPKMTENVTRPDISLLIYYIK